MHVCAYVCVRECVCMRVHVCVRVCMCGCVIFLIVPASATSTAPHPCPAAPLLVQGYCYINYSTPEAAAGAIEHLNGVEFPPHSGHRIKVMYAEPLGVRSASHRYVCCELKHGCTAYCTIADIVGTGIYVPKPYFADAAHCSNSRSCSSSSSNDVPWQQ